MSALEKLPVELLHRICTFLAPDVRNFRLVNRLFAVVGAEHLLEEITLFFVRDDFEKAREIARSPVAKGIRSLCFEPARLKLHADFESWNKHRDGPHPAMSKLEGDHILIDMADTNDMRGSARGERRISRSLAKARQARRGRPSKRMLLEAYEAYQTVYADQRRLENDQEARHALFALFKACPKLDTVTMTMANELRVTSHGKHVPSFQRAMMSPFCDESTDNVGVHALESLLLAAHEANRQLKTLHVNPISHAFFELQEGRSQILEILGSVEDLAIGLHPSYHDENCNTDEEALGCMLHDLGARNIPRALRHASKLRSLSTKGPAPSTADRRVSLSMLVGNVTWPLLTRLELYEFQSTEAELREVILRHRGTLKELELAEILLVEGDADEFFQSIAGKLESLVDVQLWGMFEARYGESLQFDDPYIDAGDGVFKQLMEEFVLKGGEMPDPEEDWEGYLDGELHHELGHMYGDPEEVSNGELDHMYDDPFDNDSSDVFHNFPLWTPENFEAPLA